MRTIFKVKISLLFISLVLCSNGIAQKNIEWEDYNFIKQSNGWLTSENASGLSKLKVNDISKAELHFRKNNGDFINYYQSDNSFDAGANIESFYRLNPKIVFYGKVGYNIFEGKDMAGSIFISPGRNSFDIVEYSDENQGDKRIETYNLVGAMSADLYKGLIFGAKIDFQAANYAKNKDLRHKNNLLDMFVSTGLNYEISPNINIGANYYYKRRIEGVEFKTYGLKDKQYFSLIDYGAFYGKKENHENNGYTNSGIEKPLFDKYHGVALQLEVDFSKSLELYNSFAYKKREGYYGKQSTSTVVYSQHSSDILEYNGKLNFRKDKSLHSLDIKLQKETLENLKNVYTIEKEVGEYTQRVIYYDPLKVGEKEFVDFSFTYTANLGIENYNPTWIMSAGVDYFQRKQVAYLYPYYRTQSIHQTQFYIWGNRNVMKGNNMYSISLGVGYLSGSGDIKNDGLYTEPGSGLIEPSSSDDTLHKEYEFLTANQLKGDVGFKYSRILPSIGIRGYASLNYSFTKASNVKFLNGDSFNSVNINIGCTF